MFDRATRIAQPQLGDDHPRVLVMLLNRARVQIARGQVAGTEATLRHVLDVRERLLSPDDWRIAQSKSVLGASLMLQGRYADAEPLMVAAAAGLKPIPGLQDRERRANRGRLVTLYEKLGRRGDADKYR